MVLRGVAFGLAALLLAGTASAQTMVVPNNVERATNTNVQPYAPQDARQGGVQAFSPLEFRNNARDYRSQPADTRTGWNDNRGQQSMSGMQGAAVAPEPMPQGYAPPAAPYQPVNAPTADYRTQQDYRRAPDYRAQPHYRREPTAQPDYRTPPQVRDARSQPAAPYQPAYDARQAAPLTPPPSTAYQPPVSTPVAAPTDYRMQGQPYRPGMPSEIRPVGTDARQQVQDFRNPAGAMRPVPGVQPIGVGPDGRYPVYEARPGVIDPRVVVPRKEEYIDYKILDGRAYDFRPVDFKPVDTRTLEYRSQDNRTPDQKVLDPRLKDKGPEILATLDCKAILYRSVECNFLDYREVDPQLQALFARYPEVAFGIVPKEYSKETLDRWQPLLAHLSREIGLKLSLKVANDYQALTESMRAGVVHVAIYSPMAYARARHTGVRIEPFAVETNTDGGKGSHAMIYTLARSAGPARADEMKGKSIGMVDPNSVAGYFVPRQMIASQKLDPDSYFGKQVFTGSHANALTALAQGLVDLAVGEWTSEEDSTLSRLLARGNLKNADGTAMRRDDFRVVAKSELIANAPITYLSDMPDDLKALIRRAMLEAPMRDRTAFEKVYEGKGRGWDTIEGPAYDRAIDLVKYMDESRSRIQKQAGTAPSLVTGSIPRLQLIR